MRPLQPQLSEGKVLIRLPIRRVITAPLFQELTRTTGSFNGTAVKESTENLKIYLTRAKISRAFTKNDYFRAMLIQNLQ